MHVSPGKELDSSIPFKQPLTGLLLTLSDEYTTNHQGTCKSERRRGGHSQRVFDG